MFFASQSASRAASSASGAAASRWPFNCSSTPRNTPCSAPAIFSGESVPAPSAVANRLFTGAGLAAFGSVCTTIATANSPGPVGVNSTWVRCPGYLLKLCSTQRHWVSRPKSLVTAPCSGPAMMRCEFTAE